MAIIQRKHVLFAFAICAGGVCSVGQAVAGSRDVYRQAMQLAAQGQDGKAAAMLSGAAGVLRGQDVWRERMLAAAALLDMRNRQAIRPMFARKSIHAGLAGQYIHEHPSPEHENVWVVGLLAVLLPGSGHAWLTRWHDAAVAAMLVWPMLLLTFWAWKRRMGPVTVFFGLLTLWLWSGTVFSAVSLAERGSMEAYMAWWQGLWQFTGLPGRPW